MIIEVQIPDDVFRQYGSAEALQDRLEETVGMEISAKNTKYQLDAKTLSRLRYYFGPFRDAEDLVKRILTVGSVRVQAAGAKGVFQLSSDQVQNLIDQAYFYREKGEPRSHADAIRDEVPKEVRNRVVQRHLQKILEDAMNVVIGTL